MSEQNKYIESNEAQPVEFIQIDELQVKSDEHYSQFKWLSDRKWLSENRYYQSQSDSTLKIDLLVRQKKLEKSISHLPLPERQLISAKKYVVDLFYKRLTEAKNLSLGLRQDSQILWIDGGVMLENRKADLLSLFAKMYSIDEVYKIIHKDWGLDITMKSLEHFRANNLQKIIELQKEYTNNYNDVRLGFKKSRLEELTWLYNDTKIKYETSQNKDDRKFLKDLLESIKREVEGDVIRIEGDIQVNIEHTLNLHVQQEIMKKLPINEVILTRVALKTGANPLLMLYRLQNSYYSKFTGFNVNETNVEDQLPEYPSSYTYDLDKLSNRYDQVMLEEGERGKHFDQVIEIKDEQTQSSSRVKQLLLEKIKKKKADLESGMIEIEKLD